MHEFEFNGVRSTDMGAVITAKPTYTAAARDLTFTTIPGRSGDIITDNNRYGNVTVTYEIATVPLLNFRSSQDTVYALTQWLYGTHDYAVLRDTYNSGYFRYAVCTGISDPVSEGAGVVTTTVTFNCKPFLYSDAGAVSSTYKSTDSEAYGSYYERVKITLAMHNPEMWASAPLIRFDGSLMASLTVTDSDGDSQALSYSGSSVTTFIIDKEQENVYDDDGNSLNDKLDADTMAIPYFPTGDFTVTIYAIYTTGSDYPTVTITPNWRRL